MGTTDTTTWRDEAQRLVPQDYTDVAAMVGVARKVRNRAVDFDWSFLDEDLRALRRVAYDWACAEQGRYKCFDARVMSAINAALGEPDSRYSVNEPKSAQGMDCVVACELVDGRFRLYGHAPFDVVFGYVRGIGPSAAARGSLGARTCATIENAARSLGWDPDRLTDTRVGPFWNALFGLAVGHGVLPLAPVASSQPERVISLDFQGPFAAVEGTGDRCLFADAVVARSGVYLWSVEAEGRHRAFYVGQTRRSFGQRTAEHVSGILTGQYDTLDLAALAAGQPPVVWRSGEGGLRWPRNLPAFLARGEDGVRATLAMIRGLRFHVAAVEGDEHLHNRIEGAIGRHFKTHADTAVSDFFGPGIKLPPKIPNDTPLRLVLSSEVPIAGLPTALIG